MSELTLPKSWGNHYANIGLGVVGMLIIIAGTLTTSVYPQKICYLVGGLFLLLSSILERQLFFSLLQIVISSGALIAFASIPRFFKALVPISLSVFVILFLFKKGLLDDIWNKIGCLGLIFLAIGYAITYPAIYFLGGLFLTLFSFAAVRKGVMLGWIWGCLNAVFTLTSGIALFKLIF